MEIVPKLQQALEQRNMMEMARVTRQISQTSVDEVAISFEESTGQKLSEAIQSRLPAKYAALLQSMFQDKNRLWVDALRGAMRGSATIDKQFVPLIIFQRDHDVEQLQNIYGQTGKQGNMIQDIVEDLVYNSWGKLIRAHLIGRNVHYVDPRHAARQIYESLQSANALENILIRLLSTTKPEAYQRTVELYKTQFGKEIETVIKAQFQNNAEFSYLLLHYYLLDPALSIAYALYNATNDEHIQMLTALFSRTYGGEQFAAIFKQFAQDPSAHFRHQGCKIDDLVSELWGLQ